MNVGWCSGQIHKGIEFDLGCLEVEKKGIPGDHGIHEQKGEAKNK